MPVTLLNLNLDTPEDKIFGICDTAGLKGKEANEVYHSLDAVRVWQDRFEGAYGSLLGCNHHSNPDDPPDLTFNFGEKAIPVEHTRLEPSHHGWMNALHHEVCPQSCITVPSITSKPNNRDELLHAMLRLDGDWSDTQEDLNTWFRFAMALIRKKIEFQPGGILVIQDTSLIFDASLRPVAEAVHSLLSPHPQLIKDWEIILHSRSNSVQFHSYLIAPGDALQRRADG